MTVRRGNDLIHVHDEGFASRLLFDADDSDGTITKLGKRALAALETRAPGRHKGINSACAEVRRRFVVSDADKFMLRRLRSLNDAMGFVRHLTEVGIDRWLEELELFLDRIVLKDDFKAGDDITKGAGSPGGGGGGGSAAFGGGLMVWAGSVGGMAVCGGMALLKIVGAGFGATDLVGGGGFPCTTG